MSRTIKIKKGLDIKLKGVAEKVLQKVERVDLFAIQPPDFTNLTPKLLVKVGDKVKAGSPLFFDKYQPEIKFTSPVSGVVEAVNRGERRRILEVLIKPDAEIEYEQFKSGNPLTMSREEITENLLSAGLWAFVKQRPYNVIAKPTDTPKAIFISAFNSAPLAADYDFMAQGEEKAFQTGVDALSKLATVHVTTNGAFNPSPAFAKVQNAENHSITGPHPAGNVGVQIHHISPINKGEGVWVVNAMDVILIGRLFTKGIFDASRIVALAGSEVENPRYYRTMIGASVKNLLKVAGIKKGDVRYIGGDVLTGTKISANGYLGFYDTQITVIPEGFDAEFLGWGMPGLGKFSTSRSFVSWLTPNKEYRLTTKLHGGLRAFVMSGQYEAVFPFDIYPVHLLKAILVEDIDLMEQLGIYEVAEEDFALCEFVCTSKINSQEIIRKGLDMMIKEFS